ncbi:hypothetical protein NPIL_118921 [Nephila pilipes]|uniref:Uncharacterized protein n=1 Tax=Nephila pilipes TaxID=299642 RepID=A0A8X6QGN5_NEPPI|nr:hypothetical protein NPIL_118921 [Nephila pilipes]
MVAFRQPVSAAALPCSPRSQLTGSSRVAASRSLPYGGCNRRGQYGASDVPGRKRWFLAKKWVLLGKAAKAAAATAWLKPARKPALRRRRQQACCYFAFAAFALCGLRGVAAGMLVAAVRSCSAAFSQKPWRCVAWQRVREQRTGIKRSGEPDFNLIPNHSGAETKKHV